MGFATRTSKAVEEVVDAVRTRIKSGVYRGGSLLPAELGLADEFEVSRGTIRRAIGLLVESGELTKRPHSRPIVAFQSDGLPTGKIREIPVWVSLPVADGSVLAFLRGVSKGLRGTPFQMVVREPRRFTGQIVHSDERQFLLDLLKDQKFAGAIIYRDHFAQNHDLMFQLGQLGKPLAFVDAPPPVDIRADFVTSANAVAGRACTEHLFELGHSRVLFVADTDVPEPTKDRIKGYRRAMKITGAEDLCRVIVASEEKVSRIQPRIAGPFARLTKPGGYFCDLAHRAVQKILATDPLPTAIFASHDVFAASLCALLAGAGLRVPEDISIVGFDWLADCEREFPDNMTTAAQSFEGFGIHAASLLLDRISGETNSSNRHVLLDAPLVVRSSTASNFIIPALSPDLRLDVPVAL